MASRKPLWSGWSALVITTLIGVATVCVVNQAAAEADEPTPVVVFLSPACARCRDRLVELLPHIRRIHESGGKVNYEIVLLSEDLHQFELAQQLLCAYEQNRFEAFFLYLSQSVIRRKMLALDAVMASLSINPAQFRRCMVDVMKAEILLEQSDNLFLSLGLTGVPSVIVGSRAFSLTDAESIIEVLRNERD